MQVSVEALGPKGGRKLLESGAHEIFVPCIGRIPDAVERAAKIGAAATVHTPLNRIADADETLGQLSDNGIRNVLMVSGNPGHGERRYGFSDLIPRFREAGLHVSVGAYPEDHFGFTSRRHRSRQITILREKYELGADRIVTQASFRQDNALRWLEDLRAAEVPLPVHLGVSASIPRKTLKMMIGQALRDARQAPVATLRNKPNLDLLVRMLWSRFFSPERFVDNIQAGRTGHGPEGFHIFSYGADVLPIIEAARRFGVAAPAEAEAPVATGPEGEAA